MAWIGVDLDGTLAKYSGDYTPGKIGDPIPAMVQRVKRWIADGKTVKIFTARADSAAERRRIADWTEVYLGKRLEVTNVKDHNIEAYYDDKAFRVERNTGKIL